VNAEKYDELAAELDALANSIAASKRPGYTQGHVDVLHNFKASAARYGTTPLQAWGVQFDKQILSIATRVSKPEIRQGEAMATRFADAINYLKLGWALMVDEECPEAKTATLTK